MHRVFALFIICAWAAAACTVRTPVKEATPIDTSWYLKPVDGTVAQLLVPGDELDIIVHSAPELSRRVTVAADGSIAVPYSEPIQVEGHHLEDVRAEIEAALARELKQPDVNVLLIHSAPRRIFVGGAVGQPGMFDLPGEIDPLQALIMAGGVTGDGRRNQVLLIRRQIDGEIKSALIDVSGQPEPGKWIPLQQFDVIYVPEGSIADRGQFVRGFLRDILPSEFAEFFGLAGVKS